MQQNNDSTYIGHTNRYMRPPLILCIKYPADTAINNQINSHLLMTFQNTYPYNHKSNNKETKANDKMVNTTKN